MRPIDALIDHLKAQQARGKTHVLLDEDARDGLRELFIKARDAAKIGEAKEKPAQRPMQESQEKPALQTSQPRETRPQPAVAEVPTPMVTGDTRVERLASLREQAASWKPATSLGTLRETMVFATGNPEARLMLVGEAPGYEEERRQEPFVGPAGQKLNDILKAMGLSREEVYISNIVKFRPSTPRQTTNNRKPTPEEMASCLPLIMKEIEIVKPDCIIALGATAGEGLLKLSGSVGSMRENWHAIDGIPTRVSYHPSYLLQSGSNNDIKRKLWEDMLAIMDKLGLPISERQRGYFQQR